MVTVVRADRLVDGSGRPPVDRPVVVVDDGSIAQIFGGRVPDGAVPDDATVLDYTGCTLLPGLIDAHVHTNLPGNGSTFERLIENQDGFLVASSAAAVRTSLESGITTVRDLGGRHDTTFEVRRALRAGVGRGSRMLLAGQPMTVTGGHCWYFGGEADGVDGVRAKVRELVKAGADWIKVIGSGGGTPNTISHRPSFRREEVAAIADEAHRFDRRVTVHCLCAEAMEYAVDAGVDGIEHASFLVDETQSQEYAPDVAERIAKAGIPVTTTLAVGHDIVANVSVRPQLSRSEQDYLDRWRRMRDDNLAQFAKLCDIGVQFIAGTDAGWRFTTFDSLPTEVWLMGEAGMSPTDAIASCTGRSAEVLGIGSETGRVAQGLTADLLAVAGDPLSDLRQLTDVRLVMQAGVVRVADGCATRERHVSERPA